MEVKRQVCFDLIPVIYVYQIPESEKAAEQDKMWEIILESLKIGP